MQSVTFAFQKLLGLCHNSEQFQTQMRSLVFWLPFLGFTIAGEWTKDMENDDLLDDDDLDDQDWFVERQFEF